MECFSKQIALLLSYSYLFEENVEHLYKRGTQNQTKWVEIYLSATQCELQRKIERVHGKENRRLRLLVKIQEKGKGERHQGR